MTGAADTWDPDQYRRFAAERRRPFDDLLALVEPVPSGLVVDLGCGTGELTAELHRRVRASRTIGVDSSAAMLARAGAHASEHIEFVQADLVRWSPPRPVDLLVASASLQWVPGHQAVLRDLTATLAEHGQLAFQVPANHRHPSHTIAAELGRELGIEAAGPSVSVLEPEDYATILYQLGLTEQIVRLQVYGFELPSPADVVEWTKGTLLTWYRSQLGESAYDAFELEYRRRLTSVLGGSGPYFYAFNRILAWARRPVPAGHVPSSADRSGGLR